MFVVCFRVVVGYDVCLFGLVGAVLIVLLFIWLFVVCLIYVVVCSWFDCVVWMWFD